jgi:hypothetical protein
MHQARSRRRPKFNSVEEYLARGGSAQPKKTSIREEKEKPTEKEKST